MKYKALYETGKNCLEQAGILEFELDARLLLEFYCHTKRHDLIINPDVIVSEECEQVYLQAIEQRALHVPLQYITGEQDFMGLPFMVNEHVLIPRQDTEVLVETVLSYMKEGITVLDMCTGSGCILLSTLHYAKNCSGVGVDISSAALDVAKNNHVALERFTQKEINANFIESDLFAGISGKYHVLISNPPYIRTEVIDTLEPEVKLYEPMGALDGFTDGLFFYREIVKKSRKYLLEGGMLFFEIGYDQGEDVSRLMKDAGYYDVVVKQDLAGLDRVVFGTWKGL